MVYSRRIARKYLGFSAHGSWNKCSTQWETTMCILVDVIEGEPAAASADEFYKEQT